MIIESLLYIAVASQILYYGLLLFKVILSRQSTKVDNYHNKGVSVIICARNERENLKNNLPKVLSQDYPVFEVIVVNDASTDDSWKVLQELKSKDERLRVINIPLEEKSTIGKKGALQCGISHARYPYLLLTDADCYPTSQLWINKMTAQFSDEVELVLGVSPYEHKGRFLHDIVTYETLLTMLQYTGWALWNLPYMGVGRNIAYTKSLYDRVGGMKSHMNLASGDDDLFVQEAIQETSVAVCFDPLSHTLSAPPSTFKSWWNQKKRHYTTGHQYLFKHRLILGFFLISKLTVYISFLLLIKYWSLPILLTYVFYLSTIILFSWVFAKKYQLLSVNIVKFCILDLLYVCTVLIQGFQSKTNAKNQW